MGILCDFCGEQRSMVHCRSDAACLCLSCDRNVHSANALSKRHSRTLLCDRCNSQPAVVRCIEEKISLCQNCDWNGHEQNTSDSGHKWQKINCYSGCPSAAELSRIWSFALELTPAEDSYYEQGMGLMSVDENNVSNFWGPHESGSAAELIDAASGRFNDLGNVDTWIRSSSKSVLDPMQCSADQSAGSTDSAPPKLCGTGTNSLGLCAGDELYGNISVDDIDMNFGNYEELFGLCQNHSPELLENAGIDSLFEKNLSAPNSNCHEEFDAEASLTDQVKAKPETCSTAVSADSMMSTPGTKTDKNTGFPARKAHSSLSLSFSGLTGETSGGDYQDCGVSSLLIVGEPPWFPAATEISFPQASRDSAVMRYKEKKKSRKFDKKIRYESRKARADVRKRVKGRFVKAGDAYDYDPLCQTRSF